MVPNVLQTCISETLDRRQDQTDPLCGSKIFWRCKQIFLTWTTRHATQNFRFLTRRKANSTTADQSSFREINFHQNLHSDLIKTSYWYLPMATKSQSMKMDHVNFTATIEMGNIILTLYSSGIRHFPTVSICSKISVFPLVQANVHTLTTAKFRGVYENL